MANITETELRRELRKLKKNSIGGSGGGSADSGSVSVGTDPPADNEEGDTFFDTTTNNLYIFSEGSWVPASKVLHIAYALEIFNPNIEGKITDESQADGFSESPFDSSGTLHPWRGIYLGLPTRPQTATSFTWENTRGQSSVQVIIEADNGTVFKNNTGTTTLTAYVYIGGNELTTAQYNDLTYSWSMGLAGKVCRYSINNQVSSIADSSDTCPAGEALAEGRSIEVGAEDVLSASKFKCTINNIPNY